MLKKTITFEDFNGEPVTEDFYFNLSKVELAELETKHEGGFEAHLNKIVESKNGHEIIQSFKEIIGMAVGRRSEDGRRFIKNQDIRDEFFQSNAFDALFMELLSDKDAPAEFVNALVPRDLMEAAKKGESIIPQQTEDGKDDDTPLYIVEGREPTRRELEAMTPDELREAFKRKQGGS